MNTTKNITAALFCLAMAMLFTGCVATTYQRDTFHQADEVQKVVDAKGNETAVPQEVVEAKSRGFFAKKDVKDFRFDTTNSWDGTHYSQSKSVSAESASADVSKEAAKITESVTENLAPLIKGLGGGIPVSGGN